MLYTLNLYCDVYQWLLSKTMKKRKPHNQESVLNALWWPKWEGNPKKREHIRTLKSRDITLPTKVHIVKAMVFPIVMFRCESWTIKKTKHWRIDAFELWCWRRLLRVPWTARRSNPKGNQSWIFIGKADAEADTPNFGHLLQKTDSLEKTLMLGKTEGRRRRGQQRIRCLDGHQWWTQLTWVWASSGRWWRTRKPVMQQFLGFQSRTWLRD